MYNREQLILFIENHIESLQLPKQPEKLYEPIVYGMSEGGKRIRPLLTLMACEAFGGDAKSILDVAVAVEMFHNFTLLHDDIMDNSAVRRGKPSVFKKWGANSAILSGDAMVLFSYKLLSNCKGEYLAKIINIFTEMALGVCDGQQYDIDFEHRTDVTIEEYMEMIRLKTSILLGAAARIGAVLGGATDQQAEAIYLFAEELGLAFQIQDDILDTYSTQEVLGKPIGGDIMEGKKTFLMITAMDRADDQLKREIEYILSSNCVDKVVRITSIYNQLGVREYAEMSVDDHMCRSLEALDRIGLTSECCANLRGVVESLRNRIK